VLSDLYPPYHKGGHELCCKAVADGLSQKGHEVYVLTSTYRTNRQSIDNNIYRLLYFLLERGAKGIGRRCVQIKIALLGRLNYLITKKTIKYVKPDIVYAGQVSEISIYPMKAIQSCNIPIVHHLGNCFFLELVEMCIKEKDPLKRFYRKLIHGFKNIDDFDFNYILVVSKALKRMYVEAGFSDDNISLIPPRGIPSELIKKEYNKNIKFPSKRIKLLYVGRLSEEKGVDTGIEAVGNLTKKCGMKKVTLHIIGDGDKEYTKELHALIRNLDLKNHIKFIGKLQHDKVLQEYSNYNILLVPSIWDAFGVIVIESMSQGVPVIASKVGGIPELIKNEETGLLVTQGNPEEMAEAIKKLVHNPSLYEKISSNGIKRVREQYKNEKIIEKIDKYMSDVLNHHKGEIRYK